ncbi:RICIN domain-containing protein [Glycomyces buryatensis]|nr:RICIN domain-containing protein [Glycomyces buryatensis]
MSPHNPIAKPSPSIGRRRLFQGAVAAGGLAAFGTGIPAAQAQTDEIGVQAVHPGMLHTQADLDRMYARVSTNQEPWRAGWEKLIANSHAQSTWTARPTDVIIRGGDGQNYPQLYNDIHAAYQNALRWRVSGNTAHRDKAVQILNAWSSTLTAVNGNSDRFLASGIYGYQFCCAADLVRGASGFNLGAFQDMMTSIFLPMNNSFLTNHNDACITNYWANWDLCNMASKLAIGIICDDSSIINQAVDYFWNGEGNGSIYNAIPFVHNGFLAQWQESGRDQGHSIMGIGLMSSIMEMAWNQGIDLYSARDLAFGKAAEYVARYNLGYNDLPFTTYSWGTGQNCAYREQTVMGEGGRGQLRPVWEMVYNHYSVRRGLRMPNVARMAALVRAEGGGGDYGTTSGGFDTLGFGTLAHTRPTPAVVSGGVYTLMAERSGKILDNGSVTTEGAQAIQWSDNGGDWQRWRITDVGGGYYTLVCLHSGKALDNFSVNTEGGGVVQWTHHGGTAQQWRLVDVGGGAVKLISRYSGKALDNGNGEANGGGAIQWTDNNVVQQRWNLRRVA